MLGAAGQTEARELMSMTPQLWAPLDPMTVQQRFDQRHGPGMTLPESFLWAVWAAEDRCRRENVSPQIMGRRNGVRWCRCIND